MAKKKNLFNFKKASTKNVEEHAEVTVKEKEQPKKEETQNSTKEKKPPKKEVKEAKNAPVVNDLTVKRMKEGYQPKIDPTRAYMGSVQRMTDSVVYGYFPDDDGMFFMASAHRNHIAEAVWEEMEKLESAKLQCILKQTEVNGKTRTNMVDIEVKGEDPVMGALQGFLESEPVATGRVERVHVNRFTAEYLANEDGGKPTEVFQKLFSGGTILALDRGFMYIVYADK